MEFSLQQPFSNYIYLNLVNIKILIGAASRNGLRALNETLMLNLKPLKQCKQINRKPSEGVFIL